MPTSSRSYRPSVDLPETLVEYIRGYAELNGTSLAELWFHWVALAARLAHTGHGHLLPPANRTGQGPMGKLHVARWKQGKAEFDHFRRAIEDVGSSVPAVLRHAGASYVTAGGHHLEMDWPRLEPSEPEEDGASEAA